MEHTIRPAHYNRAVLSGTVETAPAFSHANHGQSFFRFLLSVPRLSGQRDVLPILLPQSLLEQSSPAPGESICLSGQLRSFNNKSGSGPRLVLSVLARSIVPAAVHTGNTVQLSGTICKAPNFRRTPLGRDICDVILAVNRRYGRADYLPCICWGAVAQSTAQLEVGAPLTLCGRLQSRTYTKALPTGQSEQRTAYEVSVMRPALPEEFGCGEG